MTQIGLGREDKKSNDLFFLCSLIDYISRKTKNHRAYVVEKLGREKVKKIYDLADVYHSYNIDAVSDEFILSSNIVEGSFDNVGDCNYSIPTHWDIGKVYKRLILRIAKAKNVDVIDALFMAYNSFLSEKIDDYNSSVYYDNPDSLLLYFLEGSVIKSYF